MAAVILFLASALLAVEDGTKFAMVGLDYRWSSGDVYRDEDDAEFSHLDPLFRVGVGVTRNLAIGADLALLRTFPKERDIFLSTPVFAFGPAVTWLFPRSNDVQAYGNAGISIVHQFYYRQGWRLRLGAGALHDVGPVALGAEAGWYTDWVRYASPHMTSWFSGSSFFIGLRLSDLKP